MNPLKLDVFELDMSGMTEVKQSAGFVQGRSARPL
jgi:hypothetical protein